MTQQLTPEELKMLMENAAEKGTKKALVSMGLNIAEPFEAQKDMAFLRSQRQASEQIGPIVRRTVITVVLTGLITAAWVGFQFIVHKPPTP